MTLCFNKSEYNLYKEWLFYVKSNFYFVQLKYLENNQFSSPTERYVSGKKGQLNLLRFAS